VRLDVKQSRELQDLFIAIQNVDAPVRRVIRTYTKSVIVRPWLSAVLDRAQTTLERRVIANTATVRPSDQNIRIQSATKGRRLSGGLNPREDWAGVEHGADRNKITTYDRNGHPVTRHTARQLRPRRRSGYVFWPTAADMVPRLAALWVQTTVRVIADIFDGKEP
jgi:hypothetical protein